MNAYELKNELNKLLPFKVLEMLSLGDYRDNSGVICEGESDKILFSLDLTYGCIEYAVKNGCGLIVTHHPAIFSPVYKVDGAVAKAIKSNIGVVSVHLPADYAPKGVDYYLASALGAKKVRLIEDLGGGLGYGRVFNTTLSFKEIVDRIKTELGSVNLSVFGKPAKVDKIASFCGAGLNEEAIDLSTEADVYVSADIKHHVILKALQMGKGVIMPTHYATENYGFKKIANDFSKIVKNEILYYNENDLL